MALSVGPRVDKFNIASNEHGRKQMQKFPPVKTVKLSWILVPTIIHKIFETNCSCHVE